MTRRARAVAQLGAGRADGSYERLAPLARPALLILGDFGLKPLQPLERPGPSFAILAVLALYHARTSPPNPREHLAKAH